MLSSGHVFVRTAKIYLNVTCDREFLRRKRMLLSHWIFVKFASSFQPEDISLKILGVRIVLVGATVLVDLA